MLWALVDNKKVEPLPRKTGTCPFCKGKVHSRCGNIKAWHWAHLPGEDCDPWSEPESHWHLSWKMTFGKDNAEIVIKKNDKWHIADILTNENVVIELQNSPIQEPVIAERENFYGERMMWLINGHHFKHNFHFTDHDELSIRMFYRHNIPLKKNEKKYFNWNYARKSWANAQRYIFIDFGEDTLFKVTEGMGTFRGRGIYVSKKAFIKKYGGDYDYFCQQKPNNNDEATE